MKSEKNELVSLTDQQERPYLSKPEDFKVRKYDDPISQPFNGSCGESEAEYRQLLKESHDSSPFRGSNYQDAPQNTLEVVKAARAAVVKEFKRRKKK
jgi:hypothetical protein